MPRRRLYLLLQAAVCIALALWLSLSAIGIWREGSARRAEHPMESVYSPEVVAEKLAPIAPLFVAGLALLAVGLVLDIKDESEGKPARDAELTRDLLASRVVRPSGRMAAERRRQGRLLWAGRSLFALCMVPILVYLLNPAHFPRDDLEGMFFALMRVLLPWTAVGLGALAVCSTLAERSALREAQAAREQLKEEGASAAAPACRPADAPKKGILRAVIIAAAVILIIAGVLNGSARDVLYKAITICTECVGLG